MVMGGGLFAVVLGAASLAWACTAQLGFDVDPGGGVAGTPVTGSGDGAPGPVEIHWNGADGPVVATAPVGPDGIFAVGFTIPEVAPGTYTVVATSNQGGRAFASPASFQVTAAQAPTGPSTQTVAADLWSGFGSADGLATNSDASRVVGSSGGDGSQLAVGVGLLGSGLVALGAGFTVAEVRRRKAAVARSSQAIR